MIMSKDEERSMFSWIRMMIWVVFVVTNLGRAQRAGEMTGTGLLITFGFAGLTILAMAGSEIRLARCGMIGPYPFIAAIVSAIPAFILWRSFDSLSAWTLGAGFAVALACWWLCVQISRWRDSTKEEDQ